jgi:hypothetical protein
MLPFQKETMDLRELVNIHPQMRGKARGIRFFKIDKTGLATAGTTLAALKVGHKEKRALHGPLWK